MSVDIRACCSRSTPRWGFIEASLLPRRAGLLIEAIPRSAATYCSYAFLQAQAGPVDMGFHLHVPAHVIRAARLGVPTLVLVRQPQNAVASAVLREPAISRGYFT